LQAGTHPWEENRGMGFSYGYNRAERLEDYHTGRELLLMLIDLVSRGGNLLLDIGPAADGTIPVIMEERLAQIGEWLRPNGEAIYGTKPWRHSRQWSAGRVPEFKESQFMAEYDISKLVDSPPAGSARVEAFFTAKEGVVYAIVPRRPVGTVTIDDVQAPGGARVSLVETGQPVESRLEGGRLTISVPDAMAAALPNRQAYTFKIAGAR
jgi:alpha-L-fucosidase